MLPLSRFSVPSPLLMFSQTPARRNAAHAINLLAQRRSEREEAERFLADLHAGRHSAVD